MAGSTTLKQYLNQLFGRIVEAKNNEPAKIFAVVVGSKFNESLLKHERVFPDLRDKLKKFIETKQSDPLRAKYGKHDSGFKTGTPLAGYLHCHLRDDAILIYTLKNQQINLVLICGHSDIEGSKTRKTALALTM